MAKCSNPRASILLLAIDIYPLTKLKILENNPISFCEFEAASADELIVIWYKAIDYSVPEW